MKTAPILLSAALALLPVAGSAQGQANTSQASASGASAAQGAATHEHAVSAQASEVQQWFDRLKTLEGSWESRVSIDPAYPQMQGVTGQLTMRVTSMGNAIMHNMRFPSREDDPVTMLYLENDRLLLTHYCDAGNRPRMEARLSPDGRTVAFSFVDLAGPTKYGHMNSAAFTFVDADHHIQEWTWAMPNNTTVRIRLDLRRVKQPAT